MKIRSSLTLSAVALLLILSLALTGCYRKAAPDVTPTAAAGAESAEGGTPDIQATAEANATIAATEGAPSAETGGQPGEQAQPTPVPTVPPSPTTKPVATAAPPTPAPTPKPQPTEAPTAAPSSGPTVHTVQAGENLFRIALRYGTTVEAIASANGIANPAMIYVGQKLTIPAGEGSSAPSAGESTYVVQPGDNLFRIALRYNMSYIYLAQYNGISNPANIYVGQVLRIPPH